MSKVWLGILFWIWVISWVFVWCELTADQSEIFMILLGFAGTGAFVKVQTLTEKLEDAEKQKKIDEANE